MVDTTQADAEAVALANIIDSTATINAKPIEGQPTTPQYDNVMQRLSLLEEALLSQDPEMKKHLAEIHKLLISYEELVHLLSIDEIAKIMAAQQVATNTNLIAATTSTKAKVSVNKKAAAIGAGDI